MKKISKIILFVFAVTLVFTFYQCSKNANQDSQLANSEKLELVDEKSSGSGSIYIDCVRNCDDGGSECYVRIMPGVIRCSCEGCAMSVTTKPAGRNLKSKLDMPKIYNHFLDYIERIHGSADHRVLKYKQSFEKEYELIEIVYKTFDSEEVFSLVFYSDFRKGAGTVLVDCSGSCDSESEKCVEHYNASTGNIFCGCESDGCKMTVERID